MIEQQSLLDWKPKQAFRNTDPATSREAAKKAELRASEGRLAVLRHLMERPYTDFQLGDLVGRPQSSAGKRRGELRDHGYVEAALDGDGEQVTRLSPNGGKSMVWQITTAGIAFYENAMRSYR